MGFYLLVRRNILPPGKEGIEKLESAVQRESDMTRRRRHGGRCGSGGGSAGSERAGRRLKPQRAGEGGGREGRATAARREGALLCTSAPGPARARPWRPNPGSRRDRQPCASFPKAHLLLFLGRGKSFWKAKGQKDSGQRGPAVAVCKPCHPPPGGANVEWEGPLISSLTCNPSLCPEGRALWRRRYQSDFSPNPRDQHRALYRTPELTSQCAFVQMKQEPI